jgi:hypothetical protein
LRFSGFTANAVFKSFNTFKRFDRAYFFPRTAYVVKQKTLSVMLSETKHLVLSALTKTRFFAFGSEWQLRHSLEAGEN